MLINIGNKILINIESVLIQITVDGKFIAISSINNNSFLPLKIEYNDKTQTEFAFTQLMNNINDAKKNNLMIVNFPSVEFTS